MLGSSTSGSRSTLQGKQETPTRSTGMDRRIDARIRDYLTRSSKRRLEVEWSGEEQPARRWSATRQEIRMSKTIPLLFVSGLLQACGLNTEAAGTTQAALESATRVPQKGSSCRSDFARGIAASFENAPGFAGIFIGFDGNEVSLFHTKNAQVESKVANV
jgi:hypothetical protein